MIAVEQHRRWPWVVAAGLALLVGAWLMLWGALDTLGPMPIDVTIEGERVLSGFDLADLPDAHEAGLAAVLLFALLVVALMVPVSLLLVLTAVLTPLSLAIGLMLLGLALVLSPLLLLGWLLRRALRRAPMVST